ncbi:MAG: hypothetical protein ABIB79_01465 [archaeon]
MKIAVLIGSPFNVFEKKTLKKLIERSLKTKIEKINSNKYFCSTKEKKFYFFPCYKPIKDRSYLSSKKYFLKEKGEKIPLPVKEALPLIKDIDLVLLFGTCGTINGKRNQVFLPTKFYSKRTNGTFIRKSFLEKFKLSKGISNKNILTDLIKGQKCKLLTSNITFIPDCVEGKSLKYLDRFTKEINKKIDCIDMESYDIVKKFKDKVPIGVFLFSSDTIGKDSQMKFRLRDFQKNCVFILKKINKLK